jgi:hypothetical protein
MKQDHTYTAHIAANKHTNAFDTATGQTPESATAALKRKNSHDWKDCCIWVTDDNGYHQTMYDDE